MLTIGRERSEISLREERYAVILHLNLLQREQEEKLVREAQKLVRQEEKRKAREERAAAKAAGVDFDSEQYSSAGGAGQSEKSGSKKSKVQPGGDQRSIQSPTMDDKSKTASEMQSIGKGHHSSGDDDDDDMDEDDDGNEMDEITNLNQQTELRRELISTIEEALREQDALKKHNMDLQHQIMLMEPATFDQPTSHGADGAQGSKADAQ